MCERQRLWESGFDRTTAAGTPRLLSTAAVTFILAQLSFIVALSAPLITVCRREVFLGDAGFCGLHKQLLAGGGAAWHGLTARRTVPLIVPARRVPGTSNISLSTGCSRALLVTSGPSDEYRTRPARPRPRRANTSLKSHLIRG